MNKRPAARFCSPAHLDLMTEDQAIVLKVWDKWIFHHEAKKPGFIKDTFSTLRQEMGLM